MLQTLPVTIDSVIVCFCYWLCAVVSLLDIGDYDCDVFLLVTKHFNESNQFAGYEEKMAYVVREPIVRGT